MDWDERIPRRRFLFGLSFLGVTLGGIWASTGKLAPGLSIRPAMFCRRIRSYSQR